MFIYCFLVAALLFAVPFAAAQQPPDEKVVVTSNAYPVPFENVSRAVTLLTRDDIQKLPAKSITDVLAMAGGVDLRSRSPFGVQTDLSIRGSSYSQVLVLVDGIRINDSQTAHHNSDFPVQLQDVERIEVLPGSGSSIYGADAFGGTINIITRRSVEKAHASFSAGQYGFLRASASAGFSRGIIEQSINFTGNRSSGFEYDRDFLDLSMSSRTGIGSHSSLFISHANKEFGANGFYGPSPSKEWTNQTMVSFEHDHEWSSGGASTVHGYYRTHGDRFIYNINAPGAFASRHRTQAAGVLFKTRLPISASGSITVGGEAGGDWIRSNTLGDHQFARSSVFTELQQAIGASATVYPGVRFDYYSNFGAAASPSISAGWWALPQVKLRSSAGRAFRIPTFTELYYRDPGNEANPALKPESSWSAEAGADYLPASDWMLSATLFARRETNVIDWIRDSSVEKWRSENLRNLRTAGAELGIKHAFNATAGFSINYSRISANAGRVDYLSKYVLDYARDSWSASGYLSLPLAVQYRQTVNYRRRADGRNYFLVDGRLERSLRHVVIGLDFTNLLNTPYQEVIGVNMPGRWFVFSLRTR